MTYLGYYVTSHKGKLFAVFIYFFFISLGTFAIYNSFTHVTIKRDVYLSELPPALEYKSVAILHSASYGPIYDLNYASETVKTLEPLKADYLILDGDLYDKNMHDFENFTTYFKNIKSKKYFIRSGSSAPDNQDAEYLDNIKHMKDAGFIIVESDDEMDENLEFILKEYKNINTSNIIYQSKSVSFLNKIAQYNIFGLNLLSNKKIYLLTFKREDTQVN